MHMLKIIQAQEPIICGKTLRLIKISTLRLRLLKLITIKLLVATVKTSVDELQIFPLLTNSSIFQMGNLNLRFGLGLLVLAS